MAITYLSGERIQGSSTVSISPTLDDNFSTDNWVDNDSTHIGVSGGVLSCHIHSDSTNDSSVHDLQDDLGSGNNASNTAWVLRCKYDVTNITEGNANNKDMHLGINTVDQTGTENTTCDAITFQIKFASGGLRDIRAGYADGVVLDSGTYQAFAHAFAVETIYIEIIRTSATQATMEIFSDSGYTTSVEKETITIPSTIQSLRYIMVRNRGVANNTGSAQINIDDMKFWNNTTKVTEDEKTSITNVPVGTRYEETDTRKIFRRKIGGDPQIDDVFNSSNTYSFVQSVTTVTAGDDPTGKIVTSFSNQAFSGYSRGMTSITSGNSKTFVIKFTWERGSGDVGNNNTNFFSSYDWADNSPASGHKFIRFFQANGNRARFRLQTGSATVTSADDDDFLQATGTTRYYTITGNGSTWKGQSWSNSARTTDEETTADLSFPSDWTTTAAIDRWGVGSWSGYYAANFTLSDVSVKWDSGTADSWVEKGTA